MFESPYKVQIEKTDYAENEKQYYVKPKFNVGYQYPVCLIESHKGADIKQIATITGKKYIKKTRMTHGEAHEVDASSQPTRS